MMGEVACRLADVAVLTTDNPRSEDPDAIISQVVAGCATTPTVVDGPSRRHQRRRSLAPARATSCSSPARATRQGQVFADRVVPFDDRDVVRAALAARHDEAAP